MTSKNPYEKHGREELDIPDFVEEKTNGSDSIDMSIFKMSDDELYDDTGTGNTRLYDDDELEEKPVRKRKANASIVLCLIIIALLMLSLAGSLYFVVKYRKAFVTANTEKTQLQNNEANYKKQIEDQLATIELLNRKIEELSSSSKGSGTLKYEILDGGMRFRKKPNGDADQTTFNGASQVETGEIYNILEVVKDEDPEEESIWGKLADDVYFCLDDGSGTWTKKVED